MLVLWSWQRCFLRGCLHNIIYTVYYIKGHYILMYTQWRSWLRHCATSRNVAGSIPDGVIDILTYWHIPSGRSVILSLTQPLNRNGYQEYFLGGKDGWCVGLTTLLCRLSWNLEAITSCNPQDLSRPVTLLRIQMYVRVRVRMHTHCIHGLATGLLVTTNSFVVFCKWLVTIICSDRIASIWFHLLILNINS